MQQQIRAIDGLRGLAIFLVMLHHFRLFSPGWAGVDVFFVISGFLITRILLGTKDSPRYFANFYFRRILRILPLYYSSLALFFLVAVPLGVRYGWSAAYGMRDALWFVFHLSNWWIGGGRMEGSLITHFWSLGIEEQFYFVWPFLIFVTPRRKLIWITAAIAVASALGRGIATLLHPEQTGFIYYYTPFRIEAIALGSLAAILAEERPLWQKLVTWQKRLFWTGFTVWGVTIFLGNNRIISIFGLTGIAWLALALLIEAAESRSPFDTRFFRHLGKYSYALYVFHYPVFVLASRFFKSDGSIRGPVLTAVVGVLMSYLLARLSWIVIESPFLRLKDRFGYELHSRLAGAPSAELSNSPQ